MKTIETHARAFSTLNIPAIGRVRRNEDSTKKDKIELWNSIFNKIIGHFLKNQIRDQLLLLTFFDNFIYVSWEHGLRTPREEISFTARPKILNHQRKIFTPEMTLLYIRVERQVSFVCIINFSILDYGRLVGLVLRKERK